MINSDVINHLEKYFKLSRTHFTEGDHALAAFFAIMTIEETAKILILEAKSLEDKNKMELCRDSQNHRTKYFSAMVNLISQNKRIDRLPSYQQNEIESWWNTNKLMKIRNDCLYLRYSRNNQVTTPEKAIDINLAVLLVCVAGITIAELDDYISGLPSDWKKSILEITNTFRQKYLKE